jgi:hypothetical protein
VEEAAPAERDASRDRFGAFGVRRRPSCRSLPSRTTRCRQARRRHEGQPEDDRQRVRGRVSSERGARDPGRSCCRRAGGGCPWGGLPTRRGVPIMRAWPRSIAKRTTDRGTRVQCIPMDSPERKSSSHERLTSQPQPVWYGAERDERTSARQWHAAHKNLGRRSADGSLRIPGRQVCHAHRAVRRCRVANRRPSGTGRYAAVQRAGRPRNCSLEGTQLEDRLILRPQSTAAVVTATALAALSPTPTYDVVCASGQKQTIGPDDSGPVVTVENIVPDELSDGSADDHNAWIIGSLSDEPDDAVDGATLTRVDWVPGEGLVYRS